MLLAHETHGFGEVAVVTHHHSAVVSIEPAIVYEMHGEIDVGTLLLGPDHLHRAPFPHLLRKWRAYSVPHKMPEIHLHLLPKVLEGAEIDVLPLRLGLVGRRARDSCREVLDLEDVVMLLQDLFEQSDQPAFLMGFRREESETPSGQGARPEGTGGVLDGTSRRPTKRNAALADGSGAVADNS